MSLKSQPTYFEILALFRKFIADGERYYASKGKNLAAVRRSRIALDELANVKIEWRKVTIGEKRERKSRSKQ